MRKLLFAIPATTALLAGSAVLVPQPARAAPTCEQEIRIRCSGYDVNGRPRLDIYYDSYDECVSQETAMQCNSRYSAAMFDGHIGDATDQRAATAKHV